MLLPAPSASRARGGMRSHSAPGRGTSKHRAPTLSTRPYSTSMDHKGRGPHQAEPSLSGRPDGELPPAHLLYSAHSDATREGTYGLEGTAGAHRSPRGSA